MQPHHHGAFVSGVALGVHTLSTRQSSPAGSFSVHGGHLRDQPGGALRRAMAEFDRIFDSTPWLRLFRRHEAAGARGGSAIRNATESAHFILDGFHEFSRRWFPQRDPKNRSGSGATAAAVLRRRLAAKLLPRKERRSIIASILLSLRMSAKTARTSACATRTTWIIQL